MTKKSASDDAGQRGSRVAPPQVLLRGLSVLEALNRRTVSSVEQISTHTGLPKPTVVRMLNLLVEQGYVQRLPNRQGYVLDERVLTLSSGFRSHHAVVRVARPFLSAFTASTRWPLSLATLDTDRMRVRATTLQESPFATETDMRRLARRLPILSSALGRAYLAFCPEDERAMLARLLMPAGQARGREHLREIGRIIRQVRKTGYAASPTEPDNAAVGLAVPIMQEERVLACLSLRYLGRAMTEKEAARRYLKDLRETASAIATAVGA